MDLNKKSELVRIITEKRTDLNEFNTIVNSFNDLVLELVLSKGFVVSDYFGIEGVGIKSIDKNLINDNIIDKNYCQITKSKHGPNKDFMGLYVFFTDNTPIYVGRSGGVINRIHQHITGHSHNTSSAAFSIGKVIYKIETGSEYEGKRDEFNFSKYGKLAQDFLKESTVKFTTFDHQHHEELYLFEVYCSMRFGTNLNKFETH